MQPERRVIIVTGAAGGIGLATALRFARAACNVVLADIDEAGLRVAFAAVQAEGGGEVEAIRCDVTLQDDVVAVAEHALARFGRFDVVVNNAGVMAFKPIEQLDEADLHAALGVNLLGAFWFVKQAFLKCAPGAAVVNVSSVHAFQTSALVAPYAAAKAGLLALTRAAAIEGMAKGVRVNAVVAGAIDTPMLNNNPNVLSGAEVVDRRQVGEPDDVAAAIEFLASPAAHFVNGSAIYVDGGRLAQL